MASQPIEPITCLVDHDGRLTAADAPLLQLQLEAGGALGAPLAVPQLAAIARLALRLGVPISRPAIAASAREDLDLLVRAEPVLDGVRLTIERWLARAPKSPRWSPNAVSVGEAAAELAETFETDCELRVTRVSVALGRRLGVAPGPMEPALLTRLFKLEEDAEGEMPLLSAIAGRASFSGQRARARDGGDTVLLLSGEPVEAPQGRFLGYRCTVTAEGEAQTDAPPRFEALLREPLNAIINEAQQIAARAEGPLRSDYASYADDINAAARHLMDVLRSMGREVAADPDRVDLVALAREAAGLVQPQAVQHGVTIALEGETSLPARGQASAVTQILVNLIANAVRHAPEGSVVQVVASAGEMATILVADEGPGVAPWDRDRIFEAYEQAEPAGEGTGLGLAISRRLARSMGGDIALEETDPGEGARFTLALPRA